MNIKDINNDSNSPNNDFVILSRDDSPDTPNSITHAWYISLALVIILLVLPLILGLEADPYLYAAGAIVILTYPFILLLRGLGVKKFQLSQEQIKRNIELQKRRIAARTLYNKKPDAPAVVNRKGLDASHCTATDNRVNDIFIKHNKFANTLYYLGLFLFGRIVFLVVEHIGFKGLDPKLERTLHSTAFGISIALTFAILLSLFQLISLAWAIYPRRKALLMAVCSILTPAFPIVAYIVYRDSKRMKLERHNTDENYKNISFISHSSSRRNETTTKTDAP